MRIKIYQIETEKDTNHVKFSCLDRTNELGGVNPTVYKCVFNGDVNAKRLDDVFVLFNEGGQGTGIMQGHSLSVSDIVEVLFDESRHLVEMGCHFCDAFGWQKIEFDTSKCMELEGIRVLMSYPIKDLVDTRIINDTKHLQLAISDHRENVEIKKTNPFEDDDSVVVISNKDTSDNKRIGNQKIGSEHYLGPIIIAGIDKNGDICDLTDNQVRNYRRLFGEPILLTKEEIENSDSDFLKELLL